jgi:hypothetical protein
MILLFCHPLKKQRDASRPGFATDITSFCLPKDDAFPWNPGLQGDKKENIAEQTKAFFIETPYLVHSIPPDRQFYQLIYKSDGLTCQENPLPRRASI